jgi:hypothetical protein
VTTIYTVGHGTRSLDAAPTAPGPRPGAAPADRVDAPAPSSVDRLAARPADSPQRRLAQAEQDKKAAKVAGDAPKADGDAFAQKRVTAAVPPAGRSEPAAAAGTIAGAAARGGGGQDVAKVVEGAKPGPVESARPTEEKRLADAAPMVDARQIQLQTNTVAAGAARPRGPLATQAANTQQAAPVAPAPPPAPAAAPAPATVPAQTDARERRDNEQQAALAEVVTTTGANRGARATRRPLERAQAAGADRSASALSKDEAGGAESFGFTAVPPVFAEPGGRLQWRIVEGRRLQSSSDSGTTWSSTRYTARRRLRAGTAPGIDSAWAVGDDGLVLRFSVPGDWTVVSVPAPVTLIGVSATGTQSARVTAADGRVFETADGGATWTPATPGAGPQ